MKRRRRRTCESCGKPLGGTTADCYECGGEKPSLSREERLADAREWKLILGVRKELIDEAHSEGDA